MFGPLFNAVSPTPGTSLDIKKVFGKYLLNDCSIKVFDCELLNSRVFLVGRSLYLSEMQYMKHR